MNAHSFNGKIAIVTGAASGIGYAISEQLLENGAIVFGADINEKKLSQLKAELGNNFIGVKTDVTNSADQEALVQQAVEKFDRIDFAFNVAGANKTGTITDISEEDWRFTTDLILHGVFLGMKHQAAQMKKQNGGAILNISSLNAHVPMYGGAAYASAKSAVEMLTKNGALELARYNIRVNAVLPGLVETPLTTDFTENKEMSEAFMERIPMQRAATPTEIAKPSLFLVSEDASYVNGTSLVVDGAWEVSGYPDLSKF